MIHEWTNNARSAQSSSDRGVGGIKPEKDGTVAERPATARVGCSTAAERHDAANTELCADGSGWRLG